MRSALRFLLVMDAAVLFLLGVLLIVAPERVAVAFHFDALPAGVHYVLGLWGCVLATLAFGYVAAAQDPVQHIAWVQIGIARGALECLLGVVYLARGTVTFAQAGFGILLAGLVAVAYVVLYPRKEFADVDPG